MEGISVDFRRRLNQESIVGLLHIHVSWLFLPRTSANFALTPPSPRSRLSSRSQARNRLQTPSASSKSSRSSSVISSSSNSPNSCVEISSLQATGI